MKAWQDMLEQFQKAALGSNAPEYWRMMFAPMQQQLEVIQKALEAQEEFQRQITEQALAPMQQVLDGLQQAAKTTRAAGEALREAGDLLIRQATAMDEALNFSSPIFDISVPPRKRSAKAKSR